jgi:hypothetical protein
MTTEEEARTGSVGLSGLGRNGENGQVNIGPTTGSRIANKYRDVREEEELQQPATGYSLEDFLPLGHPLREDTNPTLSTTEPPAGEFKAQVCPVCGEFEGDEIAVSHHVATHFD